MRVVLFCIGILAALQPVLPAAATPALVQSDQERARGERERGRILGYDEIVRRATKAVPGRVVGQSLDRVGGGRYLYRLRIQQRDGKVVAVDVDARTGEIVEIRGRR